ncbi:MAG: DMT family transporter [Candidatus Aminicenantales bacterium]|jgi:drug/metabolite transporter (DMT)-like permease
MAPLLDSLGHLPHLGEGLSILAALFWAGAIIIFRIVGRDVHPLAVNLFKNGLAVILLSATVIVLGRPLAPVLPVRAYAVFFLSGVLGIAVADTLALVSLNKLGAELFAIVDCGYSPFVIVLSYLFLGERLTGFQFLGAGLIVLAVFLIGGIKADAQIPRRDLLTGIWVGLVSVFFMAAGIVMVKPWLSEAPVVWSSLMRMIGGTIGVGLVLLVHPRRAAILRPMRSLRMLRLLIPASVLATVLSNLCCLAGMALTAASVASVLNQMSTIFIFILAAIFLRERITPLKLAAVILAFAGALLVSGPA